MLACTAAAPGSLHKHQHAAAQHTAHNTGQWVRSLHTHTSPSLLACCCCCCWCSLHVATLLCAGTLLFTEAILFHWVETKRGMDLKKPGSQADGSFFGITEEFVPKENGYPGAWQRSKQASKGPAGRQAGRPPDREHARVTGGGGDLQRGPQLLRVQLLLGGCRHTHTEAREQLADTYAGFCVSCLQAASSSTPSASPAVMRPCTRSTSRTRSPTVAWPWWQTWASGHSTPPPARAPSRTCRWVCGCACC